MNNLCSAVVCSICRMIYIYRLDYAHVDATFVAAQIMLWTYVRML